MSFQGFESILEGLLGPELLEDLKLFKGKNLFHYDTSGVIIHVYEWHE